jgi:hypothetical protein
VILLGAVRLLLAAWCVAIVAWSAAARAEPKCDGPPECCPETVDRPDPAQTVRIGVVVMGIADIDERAGTWDVDYYLNEAWSPRPNFFPETEVVNEVERKSEQFDITEMRDGLCWRSRRLHSILRSPYDLHAFPFDTQSLFLEVSDDEYTSDEVHYSGRPYNLGIDEAVKTEVLSWEIDPHPTYRRESRVFPWETHAPSYDYAHFELRVRRHVTFHLTKFFLPLFVIVLVAFAAFWIDPEDLSSQLTIGITCLLAAIAFQFAEAGTLPEVAYLTFADRVYVVCYVAIGLAVVESIYTNVLARAGKKELARRVDSACRWLFPVATVVAITLSGWRAFSL